MYCVNCGAKNDPVENAFCMSCGSRLKQATAAKPVAAARSNHIKIILIAVPVLMVFAYIIYSVVLATPLRLNRAINNFESEMTHRIEHSPLGAVAILADILERGSIQFDVNYREGWTDIGASGRFYSNMRRGEYAFIGDASIMGLQVDASMYLTRDHFVAGTSLLADGDYFGIRFSTFRQDFRDIGRMMGMSPSEIDEISDMVEVFAESLNDTRSFDDMLAPHVDLVAAFLRSTLDSSSRESIYINGDTHRVHRIAHIITAEDFINFAIGHIDLIESEINFDQLRDWRFEFNQLRHELEGYIELAFYVGSRSRLARVTADVWLSNRWEDIDIFANIDLGQSITDTWVFYIRESDRVWTRAEWDFAEVRNDYHNMLTLYSNFDLNPEARTIITSDWNSAGGDFYLRLEDISSWGGRTYDAVNGNFTTSRNGFEMDFAFIDGNTRLDVELSGRSGGRVPTVSARNYIHIDQWSEVLVGNIMGVLQNLPLLIWLH